MVDRESTTPPARDASGRRRDQKPKGSGKRWAIAGIVVVLLVVTDTVVRIKRSGIEFLPDRHGRARSALVEELGTPSSETKVDLRPAESGVRKKVRDAMVALRGEEGDLNASWCRWADTFQTVHVFFATVEGEAVAVFAVRAGNGVTL